MTYADWAPALPLAVQRANEIASEQHAARMEALQARAQAGREKDAGRASNDAAFEEHLAEYRRRKADPWAGLPDDALNQTASIDKARAQRRADRESGIDTAADERQRQFDAEIDDRNRLHQMNARAAQEINQRAYEERVEQLGDRAAEREKRAETTAGIDELRRQRRSRP